MDVIIKEIKARCFDSEKVLNFLGSKSAKFIGEDHQIDTYFNVSVGRLKLREGNIECNLIQYNRNELKGIKSANVTFYKPNEVGTLKKILIQSLRVKVVVDKVRKIFFIDNVKFHIDKVKGVGDFIQIIPRSSASRLC